MALAPCVHALVSTGKHPHLIAVRLRSEVIKETRTPAVAPTGKPRASLANWARGCTERGGWALRSVAEAARLAGEGPRAEEGCEFAQRRTAGLAL